MKRTHTAAAALLCAALALTLCACGGGETASSEHKHEYKSEVIKDAGCEETGLVKYACSCGDTYEESVPAKGHDFVAGDVVPPTIFSDGYTVYTCARCGATEKKDITKYSGGPIELPDVPLE